MPESLWFHPAQLKSRSGHFDATIIRAVFRERHNWTKAGRTSASLLPCRARLVGCRFGRQYDQRRRREGATDSLRNSGKRIDRPTRRALRGSAHTRDDTSPRIYGLFVSPVDAAERLRSLVAGQHHSLSTRVESAIGGRIWVGNVHQDRTTSHKHNKVDRPAHPPE